MTATAVSRDTTAQATIATPAIVRPSVRRHSIKVELSTPAIGAELSNISLADAALDPDAIAEIRALWLKHKVLFFRDQNISPMEQQTFAARAQTDSSGSHSCGAQRAAQLDLNQTKATLPVASIQLPQVKGEGHAHAPSANSPSSDNCSACLHAHAERCW